MIARLLRVFASLRRHRLPMGRTEAPPPDSDAFRLDVAHWRAGQRDAAYRYRALYGRYFARHN